MTPQRPIAAEDLLRLRILTEAQISPGGDRVAYVVQEAIPDEDKYRTNIHLVPTEGGESVPFTQGDHRNSNPRFSPDGKELAFISDRSGKPQIWMMPLAGGEARKITDLPDGAVMFPEFSPDSKRIAFVFRKKDLDEKAADGEEQKKAMEKEKRKARVIRRIRYKEEGWGFLPQEQDQVYVVSVDDGECRQVTSGPYDCMTPRWSSDGKEILFASNREEDPDFDLNGWDLWSVPADGGDLTRLPTQVGPALHGEYSPDGKSVAYIGHPYPEDTWGYRNIRVYTTSKDGAPACLTEGIDRPFGDYTISDLRAAFDLGPVPAWSGDGKWVYAQVSRNGNTDFVALPAGGGELANLVEGDHQICSFHLTPEGKRAALVMADPVNPGEVFALDLDGDRAGKPVRLTDLNADLFAEAQVLEPEKFSIKSSDDITVEGWVLKPPGFSKEKKHPLILQIHGGPHAQYGNVFFHEFQVLAGLGYVVLYMNPRGSQGYGEDFAMAINEAWGDRDYLDLMEAVDALVGEGYIDEKRMGVAGGSYGGYMTNWIVGHTDRFAAAVTMRSVVNMESFFGSSDFGFEMRNELGGAPWQKRELYRKLSPITYVEKMTTPLLIIHSEQDHRCPIEQAEQLYTALRALKREVLFVRYPEEGHGLSRGGLPEHRIDRLAHIVEWFNSVTATE